MPGEAGARCDLPQGLKELAATTEPLLPAELPELLPSRQVKGDRGLPPVRPGRDEIR
jgi:hypothetical protein